MCEGRGALCRALGSRALLFSQYTLTLDVLEEYVTYRWGALGESYFRLDGTTNRIAREMDMRSFNAPGSRAFLYLISTRAGGQGINLATADTVVLYDTCGRRLATNPMTASPLGYAAFRLARCPLPDACCQLPAACFPLLAALLLTLLGSALASAGATTRRSTCRRRIARTASARRSRSGSTG